jgi:hypothetical protein
MTAHPDQPALFTTDPAAPEQPCGAAVPYQAADPAAYSPHLAGDGYAWLARVLPPPIALTCPRCRRPMRLPAVPLLWHCPRCDPPPDPSSPQEGA